MTELILIILGLIMIAAALAAIYSKNLVTAIVASGIVSLFASVVYLLLQAPDVAMTEAAIGSALTTIVFLYAFKMVKETHREEGCCEELDDLEGFEGGDANG